jgi:GPH family glycoside/pentoside/hexuronide:cation symporter
LQLADALADPFIGWASDNTKTRWGRRKIWIVITFVPTAVMYVAIWLVPDVSPSAKVAYYAVILIFYSMTMSCVNLPLNALAPELTSNYDERTSLMMYK